MVCPRSPDGRWLCRCMCPPRHSRLESALSLRSSLERLEARAGKLVDQRSRRRPLRKNAGLSACPHHIELLCHAHSFRFAFTSQPPMIGGSPVPFGPIGRYSQRILQKCKVPSSSSAAPVGLLASVSNLSGD